MAAELWPGRSHLQEVSSSLFLSNFFGARNAKRLREAGITHILVCAAELDCVFEGRQGLTYLRLPLADNPGEDLRALLPAAFRFIEVSRRKHGWRRLDD